MPQGVTGPGDVIPTLYPPSSVLPSQGLALMAGPLCYMYQHPAAVYRLFRVMYCRHWCKLRSLSLCGLPAPGLPVLCKMFEELLQVTGRGGKAGRKGVTITTGIPETPQL